MQTTVYFDEYFGRWKSVQRLRLGAFEKKGDGLTPFLSNDAQPQPLDGCKQTLYLKLAGFRVLLCTSMPEFDNVALKRPHIQIVQFTRTIIYNYKVRGYLLN